MEKIWNRLAGIYDCFERSSWLVRASMILLLGILLRLLALQEGLRLISRDGLIYLKMGHLIGNGHFIEGINSCPDILPLYPMLLGMGVKLGLSAHDSIYVLSLIMGILTIVPATLLGKELFGSRAGWLAMLFVACSPALVEYSGESTREATFLFFFVSGAYFSVREIKYGYLRDAIFASFGMSLAFLVRREGLVLLIASGIILLSRPFFRQSDRMGRRLINFAVYLGVWLLVMMLFAFLLKDTRMHLLNVPKLMRFVDALRSGRG